jgi:hypothetical protein
MKKLLLLLTLAAIVITLRGADHSEIRGQIKQYSPKASLNIFDPTYTSVNMRILDDAIQDHFGMMRRYSALKDENKLFDCDDYAFTFKAIVSCYGSMLGSNYECGVITVKQEEAFGGIPAGGYHALNIILIDGVMNVLEPQTYEFTPLSEYPNRKHIYDLIL